MLQTDSRVRHKLAFRAQYPTWRTPPTHSNSSHKMNAPRRVSLLSVVSWNSILVVASTCCVHSVKLSAYRERKCLSSVEFRMDAFYCIKLNSLLTLVCVIICIKASFIISCLREKLTPFTTALPGGHWLRQHRRESAMLGPCLLRRLMSVCAVVMNCGCWEDEALNRCYSTKTQCVSITEIKWITLFKEMIAAYYENNMKLVNTLSGQISESLDGCWSCWHILLSLRLNVGWTQGVLGVLFGHWSSEY